MENAVEALKIAAGVLLFVLALTVSISCFSQANRAVTSIVSMRDRDTQILYDQIKPSNKLTRRVGVETIIPSMYKAFTENIKIQFKDLNGENMPIYYDFSDNRATDTKGEYIPRKKDDSGINDIKISYIDLKEQNQRCDEHFLGVILYGNKALKGEDTKYRDLILYEDGFYNFLNGKTFEEQLGEYYPIETTNSGSTSTQIKKRVITYKVVDTNNE